MRDIVSLYQDELQDADIVIPVANSGNTYGEGAAMELKLPYIAALVKPPRGLSNLRSQRNFLTAKTEHAHKFYGEREVVDGKNIVLADDSFMRGHTLPQVYHDLKVTGAKKVVVLIAWPPTFFHCDYGIDIPRDEELAANKLIRLGLIRHTEGTPLTYDIHVVNKLITEECRQLVRNQFSEINPEDLYIRFGTEEILRRHLSNVEKGICSYCRNGVVPGTNPGIETQL